MEKPFSSFAAIKQSAPPFPTLLTILSPRGPQARPLLPAEHSSLPPRSSSFHTISGGVDSPRVVPPFSFRWEIWKLFFFSLVQMVFRALSWEGRNVCGLSAT